MDLFSLLSAVLAVAIVVLIYVGVSHLWYNKSTSWQSFTATSATYDWPQWSTTSVNGASDLRFRNCIFTVALADGTPKQTHDVTAVLNSMAVQQQSPVVTTITTGGAKFQPTMSLVRPLNPFSFAIPGFNDPTTLTGKDISAYPWCIANCVSASPIKNTAPAVVTLTGEYRTL